MAIHRKNGCRDLLVRAFDTLALPLNGLKMAEFGNQKLKFDPGFGARRLQQAKAYFEFFGIRHVSFDTNGRGFSLPYDLGHRIDNARLYADCGMGLGEFDFVTNFGTSEHVESGPQLTVFENAHRLCRYGGLMVHAVPRVGMRARHGAWKYDADWFARLAEGQGYRIEHLTEWDKCEHWAGRLEPGDELYVMAILRKMAHAPHGDFANGWPGDPHRG